MESKFKNMQTDADSVQALSVNLATSKLSLENTLKGYAEKTEALQKKVTVYDGKIADFDRQFMDVSQRIRSLELDSIHGPVAFDAWISYHSPMYLKMERTMTCFKEVIYDLQNNYNPHSGVFTVPVRGFYMCGLGIDVESFVPYDLEFCINVRKPWDKEYIIALCRSKLEGHIVSDVVVRELDVNDKVYVKPSQGIKNIEFGYYSHFFGALLQIM